MLARGRDSLKELEQQRAFEEAERKRAERRATAMFDSLTDSSPVAIEIYGTDGGLIRSNKAAERLLGKVPPPGISLFEERGLKRVGLLEPQLKRVLAGTLVETPPVWYDPTEIGLPGVPGKKVCFRSTVYPLFDAENSIARIAVVYEDITALKKAKQDSDHAPAAPVRDRVRRPAAAAPDDAREVEFQRRKIEKSLRAAEEKLRAFVQNARGYVVARFDDDGRIVAVSPSVQEIWGLSAETIHTDQSSWFAQVHKDDIERVKQTESRIRREGVYPGDYRFRVIHKDSGDTRWVEVKGSVSTVAGARVYESIVTDIGQRVMTERALAQRETDAKLLASSESDAVVVLDRELNVVSWSKAAEAATRIGAADAAGKPLTELLPALPETGFSKVLRETIQKQKPQRLEGRYDDGRPKHAGWYEFSCYPFERGVLMLVRNTSQQRRAESARRDAETKLKLLLECNELAVAIKNRKLTYTLANPAYAKVLGLADTADVIGKTDAEILKPTVSSLLASHDRKVLEDGATAELEIVLPDSVSDTAGWYRILKMPFSGSGDKEGGILDIAFDITTRVFAQQELARRKAAMGRLLESHSEVLRKGQEELERWEE